MHLATMADRAARTEGLVGASDQCEYRCRLVTALRLLTTTQRLVTDVTDSTDIDVDMDIDGQSGQLLATMSSDIT